MQRFLIHLSYSGARFRGVQKQANEACNTHLLPSVQGQLDNSFLSLRPDNIPVSYFSSRTDKGVHAIRNTAHVDLARRGGLLYDAGYITKRLNIYFDKKDVDIRVHKTELVPSGFHARFCAVGRSYLYRLCILKPGVDDSKEYHLLTFLPSTELHSAQIVRSPFDFEKFVSGSRLFQGTHNFGTFMSSSPKSTFNPPDPNRSIDSITVTEGRPLFNPAYEPLYENLQFLDVSISARSFLYHQVRKIVGALIGVGQGKLTLDCIRWMLDNPAPQNWHPRARPAFSDGLYLLQVKYPPEAFEESYYQDKGKENTEMCDTEDFHGELDKARSMYNDAVSLNEDSLNRES